MEVTPRHRYEIGLNIQVQVGNRVGITRGFQLDIDQPPRIRVLFHDGRSPSSGWFDPEDVRATVKTCLACGNATMTGAGNRCRNCGRSKLSEDA